ncbi:hypothetical protein VKT23_002151 [Stygiomarasmius scandens]|uniref:Nuclear GTPase SLIP-GC n=1 Tax=Marasmiellus scandens TaxID=2682957 RepID=A0ABR1K1J1_9AGAR
MTSSPAKIKPEPQEVRLPFGVSSSSNSFGTLRTASAKPELTDTSSVLSIFRPDASNGPHMNEVLHRESSRMQYTEYTTPGDIPYEPELALKEGLGMVKTIKKCIQNLQFGSKMRQSVWSRDLKSLEEQTAPTTLIAVCGGTGVGKSSLLNAVLDDNVVPTSGMRACTAVVTEIGYHDKNTIDADVSFLTEAEWKQELAVLLHDLVDEDGSLKRTSDLKSDAGVAWHKVNALYPALNQDKLVTMTPDQIIAHDPRVSQMLGTTKNIVAQNSKVFGEEIAKYIDSKETRGKKDKKDKKKKKKREKDDDRSLEEKAHVAAGKSRKTDPNAPTFWPLIRQVNVRCKSACLSTGAVLVDLPGVADANAARAGIAKNYMKKCQYIWILAPITRAVDDKTARDLLGDAFKMQLMNGNYDDHTITFIASKCDDISCSEVIDALNLDDDPDLQDIEDEIENNEDESKVCEKAKAAAEKSIKAIDSELKDLRPRLSEYQSHLEAIKQGISFTPTLTKSGKRNKRKNNRDGKKGSSKRRRSGDENDLISDDDEDTSSTISSGSDSDSDSDLNSDLNYGSDSDADNDSEESRKSDESGSSSEEEGEEVTERSLKMNIDSTKDAIKGARMRLSEARNQKKSANDRLETLKRELGKIQRRKNAFCSRKRSEYSKDVLREDFRSGLKDLDDATAEERDPENFDPTHKLRDYDAINLPVFTCSSRDYVRLTGQVKGDGEPTCFTDKESTSIPALQRWCHSLTLSSRARSANIFYNHLKAFANTVRSHVLGIDGITAADRDQLRQKWESNLTEDGAEINADDNGYDYMQWGWGSAENYGGNPFAVMLGTSGLYIMPESVQPKRDEYGRLAGITPRLVKEFTIVIDKNIEDLQAKFQDGLKDRCRAGAASAAGSAVATSDDFAASMHWATYRATLRRYGAWQRDLNSELLVPFTKNIATAWGAIFEQDLFASVEVDALNVIRTLLCDVEVSAALGLKDRVKSQGELCLEEAKVAMQKSTELVRSALSEEQKDISRLLAPLVQHSLKDGYELALEQVGRGSVARQKTVFHHYVAERKDDIFDNGADTILTKLSGAAEAVGKVLHLHFFELAKKIEANLSVLWEHTQDDPIQVTVRREAVDAITSVLRQVELWIQAAKDKREETAAAQALLDSDVDMN